MHLTSTILSKWLSELNKNINACKGSIACRIFNDHKNKIACDRFGEICWFYWYESFLPSESDILIIDQFAIEASSNSWVIRIMQDRGQGLERPEQLCSKNAPNRWIVEENKIKYAMYLDRGFSPGLFTDQKVNRQWVFDNSKDKKVLNLFSYTGGFGLAAAKGNAEKVINIDASKNYTEWAKENCDLNQVKIDCLKIDAFDYLSMAKRKKINFDMIIIDPPTFSRNKVGSKNITFRIEKDLHRLVSKSLDILAPQGIILVCTNYEKWSYDDLTNHLESLSREIGFTYQPAPAQCHLANKKPSNSVKAQLKSILIYCL